MDEYISASEINAHIINDNFENSEKGKICYQIQANRGNDYAIILGIGKFTKVFNVLLNKVNLSKDIECIIISKLYDIEELEEVQNSCQFTIIKVIILKNGKLTSYVLINFNTFDHYKNKQDIKNYLSDKNNKHKIKGYYTMSFHYKEGNNNKKIILENFKTYPGSKIIMEKLSYYLNTTKLKSIIDI